MARDLTALFTSSLVLLLCPRPDAFVPSARAGGDRQLRGASSDHRRSCPGGRLAPARQRPITSRGDRRLLPLESSKEGANSPNRSDEHAEDTDDHDTEPRLPADGPGPDSVLFRVLRGGRYNTLGSSNSNSSPEADLVEVFLDKEGGGGLDNYAQNLRDFLFLVRSSQPGSIGEELQRRGIRVFPEEAFVDVDSMEGTGKGAGAGTGSGLATSTPVTGAGTASAGEGEMDDSDLCQFSWVGGTPLPLDTPMAMLPRDKEGRARLVLWDPCGPDHPLVRAVESEPCERASIEVLNFVVSEEGAALSSDRDKAGGERASGDGGGGFTRGYGDDFSESRSAVVFRNWFSPEQQKVFADALAAQIFSEDDGEGPGLAVDREHYPLLRDRAALAAVGDSMLSALSSERFSGEIGRRDPPVPTRANREFNAVCYGAQAKMQEHRDTWKEWTLIVSIGNTIPFDLGTAQGSPSVRLELSSGEGLLFNGYELFHEVHGVKAGTAPSFWETHTLSIKGGFARVGFLSMKSFNSRGVSAPTWGPEKK